tara:strand:- start:787 stop:1470 length:684 start_codon:yes stop_codon:yes gene_type:complete
MERTFSPNISLTLIVSLTSRIKELRRCLPPNVNLLAVSKGHDIDAIKCLANCGQVDFGESRLQEALPKISKLNDFRNLKWHFVGRLQKNKVRGVVQKFDVIQSVDSFKLAERVSRISEEENRHMEIMLQVKFLEDKNKGGFDVVDVIKYLPKFRNMPHLNVIGLMTIPPRGITSQERKHVFKECRNLSNSLSLKDCSMGMSNDWEEAVEAGATWIRIGSLLFGERSK